MKKKHIALGVGGALGAALAWKFATRKPTVRFEDVEPLVANSEHSHFLNIDGCRLHLQEFGDRGNPAIILIHGFTASTYVWSNVAQRIADNGFHVIAPDLVGFGYSAKPAWFEYTIGAQARIIERLMDRLGVGRATLVGSSYGGAIAMSVALDYSERVEKLALISAVANDEAMESPLIRAAKLPGIGEFVTPFLLDTKFLIKLRARNTFAPENIDLITEDRVNSVHRPLSAADAHHSVLTSARNWHAKRLEKDANLINQPTLLIWGEDDKVIPIHNGHKLYDSILHARFVVLKECGHLPQEEKPELFVELITEFCHERHGKLSAHSDENEISMLKN